MQHAFRPGRICASASDPPPAAAAATARGYRLVRAEAGAPAAELYLYDVIGADMWTGGGISAKRIIEDLVALGSIDALDVRVNSPGGDAFDGIAIYNALARLKARVTVHVDGLAASIASIIAMAGSEIRVAENAMFMVHQPSSCACGTAPEMRQVADALDKVWSAMLATYSRRTGRRPAAIAKDVAAAGGEWWLTAAEAVAAGFADVVAKPPKDAPQAFGLARFHHVPERLAATAEPAAPAATWTPPTLVEVAAPRVTKAVGVDEAQASRRRQVALLRARS